MRAVIREKEVGYSANEKSSERMSSVLPDPHIVLVFKNGKGNIVEEKATMASWEDSILVRKTIGEIRTLERRRDQIPGRHQRLSQKRKEQRKHGGQMVSKRELRQRREKLIEDEEGIPDKISQKRRLISEAKEVLEENLPQSNPLDPLRIEVIGEVKVKGEPLSPADQEWWRFVRCQVPEVWGFVQDDHQIDYNLVYGFFLRRLALHQAKGLSRKREEEAQRRLNEFMDTELDIPDQDYERIEPILSKVTAYFSAYGPFYRMA